MHPLVFYLCMDAVMKEVKMEMGEWDEIAWPVVCRLFSFV